MLLREASIGVNETQKKQKNKVPNLCQQHLHESANTSTTATGVGGNRFAQRGLAVCADINTPTFNHNKCEGSRECTPRPQLMSARGQLRISSGLLLLNTTLPRRIGDPEATAS
ncbi:hypothetical protein RRG08_007159 [Elysia crispata]|uniref:Uncharacterized protein n=1 Tax=Elysia crispata TaxID=231223 RepID=A0AAE0YIF0_9GAST|nr:hypothetical protein RRG08_007159 [Elysia crispata]